MTVHQALAIRALNNMRDDDFGRARRAFAGFTPEQMNVRYGESDKTCAEILAGYEEHDAQIDAAIVWVAAK